MPSAAQDEFDAMYDIQEKRAITHPEDTQSSSSDNDSTTLRSSHEHATNHIPTPRPSTTLPSSTYHIPSTTTFNANTGPKGVIADARSFDSARKRSFRQTLRAYSSGELSPPIFGGKNKKPAFNFSREKSPSPDNALCSADENDEDEFMRTWRANRLNELAHMRPDVRTRRSSPSMRKYGSLVDVDALGYLDAIEKVHKETTVVVLIYDDQSDVSHIVEDALRTLAPKYDTNRFIKLHYLEAEMDEVAVPGILAYRAGDCVANLVSIVNEIPEGKDMNAATLEWVLQSHKVLL
ncbi:MAG: hypothetical protein Q9182_004500 [Xanthomendoza sp. 2 TL-2023]